MLSGPPLSPSGAPIFSSTSFRASLEVRYLATAPSPSVRGQLLGGFVLFRRRVPNFPFSPAPHSPAVIKGLQLAIRHPDFPCPPSHASRLTPAPAPCSSRRNLPGLPRGGRTTGTSSLPPSTVAKAPEAAGSRGSHHPAAGRTVQARSPASPALEAAAGGAEGLGRGNSGTWRAAGRGRAAAEAPARCGEERGGGAAGCGGKWQQRC